MECGSICRSVRSQTVRLIPPTPFQGLSNKYRSLIEELRCIIEHTRVRPSFFL
jgi:hypothetical protein